MGENGYLSLTNFGLAKIFEQNEKTYSFCGICEVLKETCHSFPVDWWPFGVVLY